MEIKKLMPLDAESRRMIDWMEKEMEIKKLMPLDAESRRMIDWMEKGVYDALQKKYLKMLLFSVCEEIDGPMIEEYAFIFSYSDSGSPEVSMNINVSGNKKEGGTFKYNFVKEITPNQMRSSACEMKQALDQMMRMLDKMPEEPTILMKLVCYDDVMPPDYQPPFFKGCSDENAHNPCAKSPLKMEVVNVNTKHFVLALKVKSVLDPCNDENGDMEENDLSLGSTDSDEGDGYSDWDCEVNQSQEDSHILASAGNQQLKTDTCMVDEGEQQLTRVKDWINSVHCDTVELADILSNFTDISVALTEEIIEKLVKEGVVLKVGTDVYTMNKHKGITRGHGSTVVAVRLPEILIFAGDGRAVYENLEQENHHVKVSCAGIAILLGQVGFIDHIIRCQEKADKMMFTHQWRFKTEKVKEIASGILDKVSKKEVIVDNEDILIYAAMVGGFDNNAVPQLFHMNRHGVEEVGTRFKCIGSGKKWANLECRVINDQTTLTDAVEIAFRAIFNAWRHDDYTGGKVSVITLDSSLTKTLFETDIEGLVGYFGGPSTSKKSRKAFRKLRIIGDSGGSYLPPRTPNEREIFVEKCKIKDKSVSMNEKHF
ncbi:Meiosis-specific protein ASY1 [Linum perenne]